MFHFTALVTCLSIALYFFTSIRVAKARAAFGIRAPAISGDPAFERVFRVQMNTLEWMPIFLPSLWLFAVYVSDPIAALHWPRLDRRPHSLYDRLFASGRKAQPGIWDSGHGGRYSLDWRGFRNDLAFLSCVTIEECGDPMRVDNESTYNHILKRFRLQERN